MSLSSTSYRNNYTGNNATSVYPYTFKVFDNTQFEVKVRLIATGVETTLALTTDYTVSGVLSSTGGNITLVNASQAWLTSGSLLSTYEISIRRVLPLTQLTSIRNLTDFLPELHEDQFDRAVMIEQQIQGQIDASLRMATSVDPASFNPVIPATYYGANRPILMLNTTGTALEATPYTLANLIAAVTLGGPFTASRVLQSNSGTGLAEASAVTNTELSYLSGVTSAIQTQLNATVPIARGGTGQTTKSPAFDALSPMTTGGDLIYGGTAGTGTRLANGLLNQMLTSSGGTTAPAWSYSPFGDVQTKTTTYTALVSDSMILCSTAGGAWTLTFPTAVGCAGKILGCKKTTSDFSAVTLAGTGMTTNYLMTIGETVWFQSDGTNWVQIYRKTDVPWTSFTPTGSWNTNVTYTGKWRRVADSIEMDVYVVCSGAPTSATLTFNIVNSASWTIDTAKLSNATNTANIDFGQTTCLDSGVGQYLGVVGYNSTTVIQPYITVTSTAFASPNTITQSSPFTFGNLDSVNVRTVPIPITNFSA